MNNSGSFLIGSCTNNSRIGDYFLNSKARSSYSSNLDSHCFFDVLKFCFQVLRDGQKTRVNAEDLTRGDIVFVKAGDRLPADIRIIEAK